MKVLIYPMNYENRELMIFKESLKEEFGQCIFVASDNTKTYYESLAHSYNIINFECISNFNDALELCDSVVFVDNMDDSDFHIDKIIKAIDKKKKIYLTQKIYKKLDDKINYNFEIINPEIQMNSKNEGKLLDIGIPIITILGLGLHCDKFTCELLLREYFIKQGYEVLQFGSKSISPIFGFECLPDYLQQRNIPIETRALAFNNYIVDRITSKKADIIIIGIPEGIMPLNKAYLNNFGEIAQVVSNALPIDYSILGMYNQQTIDYDFVDYLKNYIYYKFGSELSSICVSHTMYEFLTETQNREVRYFHLDVNGIETETRIDYPIPYFKTDEVDKLNNIFNKLYSSLTENIETI